MGLSNAERQARWRERRADDWKLFVKTARMLLRTGGTAALETLPRRWPKLEPDTKRRLARAADPDAVIHLL
jgi:hypothetical protein